MNEIRSWDQLPDEPNRWYQRFELFRLAGPDRSVLAVFNQWRLAKSRDASRSFPKSWRLAVGRYNWRERAEAWDKYISTQAAVAAEAERLKTLSTGYAAQDVRVRALNELAELLQQELLDDDRRWLPDVKGIGSRENFERVDIVHFNSSLIEQFRDTLADIAAEMGERVKNVDVKSGGQALKIEVVYADPDD